jgi:hypothetical protein
VVRLFHRESECYISAEGSFALRDDIEDGIILLLCLNLGVAIYMQFCA